MAVLSVHAVHSVLDQMNKVVISLYSNWTGYFHDCFGPLTFWCSFELKRKKNVSEFHLVIGTTVLWTLDLGGSLVYLGGHPCCCWRRIMRPRSWRIDECLSKVSFMCRSKSCFCLPIQCWQREGVLCWTYGLSFWELQTGICPCSLGTLEFRFIWVSSTNWHHVSSFNFNKLLSRKKTSCNTSLGLTSYSTGCISFSFLPFPSGMATANHLAPSSPPNHLCSLLPPNLCRLLLNLPFYLRSALYQADSSFSYFHLIYSFCLSLNMYIYAVAVKRLDKPYGFGVFFFSILMTLQFITVDIQTMYEHTWNYVGNYKNAK